MQKILITGPESSGKSELAAHLAEDFACPWVPEYARDYLGALSRPYREEDLGRILEGQLAAERALADPSRPYLFCDTGPEVILIWSEVKYGRVAPALSRAVANQAYDLHLLCYPDLPWTPDPFREAPEAGMRQKLFDRYLDLHERMGWSYHLIRGQGEARWRLAREVTRRQLG